MILLVLESVGTIATLYDPVGAGPCRCQGHILHMLVLEHVGARSTLCILLMLEPLVASITLHVCVVAGTWALGPYCMFVGASTTLYVCVVAGTCGCQGHIVCLLMPAPYYMILLMLEPVGASTTLFVFVVAVGTCRCQSRMYVGAGTCGCQGHIVCM
jgi:hypothetical protein